ncbi:hypothetical protein ACOME3_001282 [Neoechinorhynchus agilis]
MKTIFRQDIQIFDHTTALSWINLKFAAKNLLRADYEDDIPSGYPNFRSYDGSLVDNLKFAAKNLLRADYEDDIPSGYPNFRSYDGSLVDKFEICGQKSFTGGL